VYTVDVPTLISAGRTLTWSPGTGPTSLYTVRMWTRCTGHGLTHVIVLGL